jgi:hypothetical protein
MLLHAGYGMRGAVHIMSRSLLPRAFDEHTKILIHNEVREDLRSCEGGVESSVFGLVVWSNYMG